MGVLLLHHVLSCLSSTHMKCKQKGSSPHYTAPSFPFPIARFHDIHSVYT